MSIFPSIKIRSKSSFLGCLLAISTLTATAQEPSPTHPDANTHPMAAEVNGVKILHKEVDYVYGRQAVPSLPPEAVIARKRAILAELVRAEVLAQKATESKLDQSADFETEMSLARRSALAEKVERQILDMATRITPQQALDYVNTNPRLFSERQLLTLEVMNLNSPDESLLDKLDKASDDGAGLEKMERLIREARGDSQRKVVQNSSDRLPPDLLKALTTKPYKPVVIKFNDNKQRGTVIMLRSTTPAPLSGNEAVNVAGNLLQNRQLQSAKLNSVNALVNAAKVNYFGLYSGTKAGGDTSLDADLVTGSLYKAPISRTQKVGIAAAVSAASTLLVLLLLTSRRYWTGNSRRSNAPNWLQRIPLLNKLIPQQQAGAALAQALAESTSRSRRSDAAWYGKLLVLLCLAGCIWLLWLQSLEALDQLPKWVMAVAGGSGLAFGLLLAWIWLRSSLAELGKNRRWVPVTILSLLTAGASASGLLLS